MTTMTTGDDEDDGDGATGDEVDDFGDSTMDEDATTRRRDGCRRKGIRRR
jgi:hypothetical protein